MIEAHKIGVTIALRNEVSSVLKIIGRDMLGLGRAVDGLQGKFSRMHLAVGGAAFAVAGLGFLDVFKDLAEAGGAVLDQQAKMAQIGISNRDITLETAEAYKNIAISGTTIAGNMAAALKLRSIFGGSGFTETNLALPAFLKAQFSLQGAGIDPSSIEDFIKPLDVMGAFRTGNKLDPAKFGPAIQMAVSAVLSSGGLLTGAVFQRAIQLAGPVAAQMGEQTFLNTMLEPLLALGTKAARGLMYGGTTFIGGQMSKASAARLDRLGLTTAGDYTHAGSRWTLDPNKIKGYQLLNKGDIVDWTEKYFLPAAAAAGMSPLVAASSLPQTLQALVTSIYELGPQIAKSILQQQQANAADPYTAAQAAWSGATDNLKTALTGLWQALGTPAATMAVPILNGLADAIRSFSDLIYHHQAAVKVAEVIMVGLGAAMVVFGSIAVGAAVASMIGTGGAIALVAGGLVALAAAFTVLQTAFPKLFGAANHQHMHHQLIGAGYRRQVMGWVPDTGFQFGPDGPHGGVVPIPPSPPSLPLPPPPSPYANETHRQVHEIHHWIRQGAPVHVTNPEQIGAAAAGGAASRITRALTAPQTGSSTANYRSTPSGSAATAAR